MSKEESAIIKRHDRMVRAIRRVTEDMIKTGMKSWSCTYFNGFKVTIRDTKSSTFRAKERLKK